MSLIDHWQANKTEFETKKVHQFLGYAGDGSLKDGNVASREFRGLLKQMPINVLKAYSDECIVGGFKDSGLALQDIVNEVGLSHSSADDRDYWHLVVVNAAPGDWKLIPLQGHQPLELGQYLIQS